MAVFLGVACHVIIAATHTGPGTCNASGFVIAATHTALVRRRVAVAVVLFLFAMPLSFRQSVGFKSSRLVCLRRRSELICLRCRLAIVPAGTRILLHNL